MCYKWGCRPALAGCTPFLVKQTLGWRWLEPRDRWWEPYVWLLLCAALAGVVVLLFAVAYAGEILRALRLGG